MERIPVAKALSFPKNWKDLRRVLALKTGTSLDYSPNRAGVFDTVNLILRLLKSKDGVALRRLLMTADGASLIIAFVSKEASFFRQQLCRIIADALYQWMFEAFTRCIPETCYNPQLRLVGGSDNRELDPSSRLYYRSFLRDRRLKVIFFKDS